MVAAWHPHCQTLRPGVPRSPGATHHIQTLTTSSSVFYQCEGGGENFAKTPMIRMRVAANSKCSANSDPDPAVYYCAVDAGPDISRERRPYVFRVKRTGTYAYLQIVRAFVRRFRCISRVEHGRPARRPTIYGALETLMRSGLRFCEKPAVIDAHGAGQTEPVQVQRSARSGFGRLWETWQLGRYHNVRLNLVTSSLTSSALLFDRDPSVVRVGQ